jgi:glycosyltransferase involved in cell wall biosynthesis
MNILFVLYHDFSTASAIHVHNFANLLVKNGHQCGVAVPENKNSVLKYMTGDVLYSPDTFAESLEEPCFCGTAPDIIHAWTPRENVRKQCCKLQERYPESKLVVHLEDNEEMIVESFTKIPFGQLTGLSERRLQALLPDLLASPLHYPLFIKSADAVTVITEELLEFVSKDKKHLRLWPVIDLERFSPTVNGTQVRKRLGISKESFVLCYVGSVHGVNAREVRSLYLAVYLANCKGIPVRLIRAGRDVVDFLGDAREELLQYVDYLGYVDADDVPGLMACADVLVQPGRNDRFNRYRLPSKIPEFLAIGKAVAVPRVNIGLQLQDGYNALLMEEGDALSIVAILEKLHKDIDGARSRGEKGRIFAEQNFSEETVYGQLQNFYSEVLNL